MSKVTIPEVEDFLNAKKALEDFEEQHEEEFNRYRELAAEHNRTLEQADKAVRAQGISSGPFIRSHVNTKIDADKLYELVGRDEFLRLGGKLETVVQYSVDKTKFLSLASSNQVPKDLAAAVTIETPNYKAPKPVKLP